MIMENVKSKEESKKIQETLKDAATQQKESIKQKAAKLKTVNDYKSLKNSDRCIIMGFAPDSRNEAPVNKKEFDQEQLKEALIAQGAQIKNNVLDIESFQKNKYDIWSINELMIEMPILSKLSTLWFQLHGTEPPTQRDANPKKTLSDLPCPVAMWRKHPEIPNSIEFPRKEILKEFDIYGKDINGNPMCPDIINEYDRQYFTNTISWLIALAIAVEYKEIHVYGVNMAQEQEYESQRPSCEFYMGIARGRGIGLHLPKQSDLLLSGYQYGFDETSRGFTKQLKRETELRERRDQTRNQRIQLENQARNALGVEQHLSGALENTDYMIKLGPKGYESNRGGPVTTQAQSKKLIIQELDRLKKQVQGG